MKHIAGAHPGEFLGLQFNYINMDLGEAFLVADLVYFAPLDLSHSFCMCKTDQAMW